MTCGDENVIYFALYKIKRNRKNKTKTISSHKGLTIIYYSREELKIFFNVCGHRGIGQVCGRREG